MQGWIKLHREITEKVIWSESTPEQKTILITLLMMANHKEKEWVWQGDRYKASPGEFVTSLASIVEKCGKGITVQNVRTALKKFESYGFLTYQSTNKNRLVTIVNWGIYQDQEEELTSKPTGNQQATNKQLTTNKNVKNVRMKEESNNTSSKKHHFNDDHMKLAELLAKWIKHNNPKAKAPLIESWANDIRLMMERDERSAQDIKDVILFSQKDSFWLSNILSTSKLRKKFDQLYMKMNSESKRQPSNFKVMEGGKNKTSNGHVTTDINKLNFSK